VRCLFRALKYKEEKKKRPSLPLYVGKKLRMPTVEGGIFVKEENA